MVLPKLGLGDAFKEAISQSVTFEDEHEWALAIVKTPIMIAHRSLLQKWMLNDLHY
jgi:hypothetical protein